MNSIISFLLEKPELLYFPAVLGGAYLWGRNPNWMRGWRKIAASWSLFKLRRAVAGGVHPAALMKRVRRVDPFVFEEMILTALKRRGLKIRRNRRYTGDGGVDGRFWIDGSPFLIQAKRYRGKVDGRQVGPFSKVCARHGAQGILVHTGKTDPWARRLERENDDIEIVSGDAMLALLTDQTITLFGRTFSRGLPLRQQPA